MQEHDRIFECYIRDLCPVCGCKVDGDSFTSHTIHGGKTVSYDFECEHCNSHYIVGLERTCKPIKSEILIDGTKTKTSCDLTKRYTDSQLRRNEWKNTKDGHVTKSYQMDGI